MPFAGHGAKLRAHPTRGGSGDELDYAPTRALAPGRRASGGDTLHPDQSGARHVGPPREIAPRVIEGCAVEQDERASAQCPDSPERRALQKTGRRKAIVTRRETEFRQSLREGPIDRECRRVPQVVGDEQCDAWRGILLLLHDATGRENGLKVAPIGVAKAAESQFQFQWQIAAINGDVHLRGHFAFPVARSLHDHRRHGFPGARIR